MRYGHLEKVELVLRTLSPVFIGSGEKLTKKEYIYDKNGRVIYMLNLAKLVEYLSRRKLEGSYERFLLSPNKNDLQAFLYENGVSRKDYKLFTSYAIDAGEVAASEKFRGVLMFVKGSDGKPYIPGSSLKGAIRTAIGAKLLEKGNYDKEILKIEESSKVFKGQKTYVSGEAKNLESRLFCKLGITDPRKPDKIKWNNIVNDFMKGISISDSLPIDLENLTLCGKHDRKPDGRSKQVPIYRECLAPDTEARFVMTLDRTIMDKVGIDLDFIQDALQSFSKKHFENFEKYYRKLPEDAEDKSTSGVKIILGGGAGYVSKTLTYPLIRERERSVKLVSDMMVKLFRIHKHEKDLKVYKVSPHILKTTMYKGKYYHMGKCELMFR